MVQKNTQSYRFDESKKKKSIGLSVLERNRMVEKYLPLVRAIAADVSASTSSNVDYDDLVSAGVFGLMDSVRSFDRSRGIRFSSYCKRRIRGAMLDELRHLDWVPRWTRQKYNAMNRTEHVLEAKLCRRPTDKELASEMGVAENKVFELQASVNRSVTSLESAVPDQEASLGEQIRDPNASLPDNRIEKEDAKNYITRSLSQVEKMVITLYYYEEMTMQEIGRCLDISESRVSQIHSEVVRRLRARVNCDRDTFFACVC